ncbi:MAG: ankyrin repeat domain-containing protein [Chlamydiales bacterium]|nr:ankyrin repeat domain-containing protein [Chlamydiales bacterium]
MDISSALVYADKVCDFIPFVSTASSAINLFQKYGPISSLLGISTKSRYWEYIQGKPTCLSVVLLIPILGNFISIVAPYIKGSELQQDTYLHQRPLRRVHRNVQEIGKDFPLYGRYTDKHLPPPQLLGTPSRLEWNLLISIYGGDLKKLEELLQVVNPNFYAESFTPLFLACKLNQAPAVRLLLAANADPEAYDHWGVKPLALACLKGNLEIVELLAKQCDINSFLDIPNPLSETLRRATPLEIARAAGHQSIVAFLKEKGAREVEESPPQKFESFFRIYSKI